LDNFNKVRKKITSSSYLIDISLQGSGSAIAQVIGVLSMPILTRLYTPAQFGVLNIFVTVVSFLTIIVSWRFEYFIVLPKKDASGIKMFKFILFYGLIAVSALTIAAYFFGDQIAKLLSFEDLSTWMIFIPITALFISLSVAIQQLVQRSQKYLQTGLSEVVNKVGYFSFALVGYYAFAGTFGLMLATAFGLALKISWLAFSDRKLLVPKEKHDEESIYQVLNDYKKASFSFSLAGILQIVAGYVPIFIISKYYGSATLGQWALVTSTLYLPTSVIGTAIGQVYFQRAAKLFSEGEKIRYIWLSTVKTLTLIAIPTFSAIALLSPWGFPILFGAEWKDAGSYASVFSIAAAASFVSSPLDRTCLIVNVWQYPFIWNTIRMIGGVLTGLLCIHYEMLFSTFLKIQIFQVTVLYLADLYINWWFATRNS
jgi:teichuronic acid exporter